METIRSQFFGTQSPGKGFGCKLISTFLEENQSLGWRNYIHNLSFKVLTKHFMEGNFNVV